MQSKTSSLTPRPYNMKKTSYCMVAAINTRRIEGNDYYYDRYSNYFLERKPWARALMGFRALIDRTREHHEETIC